MHCTALWSHSLAPSSYSAMLQCSVTPCSGWPVAGMRDCHQSPVSALKEATRQPDLHNISLLKFFKCLFTYEDDGGEEGLPVLVDAPLAVEGQRQDRQDHHLHAGEGEVEDQEEKGEQQEQHEQGVRYLSAIQQRPTTKLRRIWNLPKKMVMKMMMRIRRTRRLKKRMRRMWNLPKPMLLMAWVTVNVSSGTTPLAAAGGDFQ